MFTKELKADYLGHHIAVRNSWGPGLSLKSLTLDLELYIDGEIADTNLDYLGINNKAALLRGAITDQGQRHLVEVYGRSSWRRRLKICVDGTKIAGDLPQPPNYKIPKFVWAAALMTPANEDLLVSRSVNKAVGNVKNNGPDLLA